MVAKLLHSQPEISLNHDTRFGLNVTGNMFLISPSCSDQMEMDASVVSLWRSILGNLNWLLDANVTRVANVKN